MGATARRRHIIIRNQRPLLSDCSHSLANLVAGFYARARDFHFGVEGMQSLADRNSEKPVLCGCRVLPCQNNCVEDRRLVHQALKHFKGGSGI